MYGLESTISWHGGVGLLHRAKRSQYLAVVWTGSQKVVHVADFQPCSELCSYCLLWQQYRGAGWSVTTKVGGWISVPTSGTSAGNPDWATSSPVFVDEYIALNKRRGWQRQSSPWRLIGRGTAQHSDPTPDSSVAEIWMSPQFAFLWLWENWRPGIWLSWWAEGAGTEGGIECSRGGHSSPQQCPEATGSPVPQPTVQSLLTCSLE